MPEFPHKLAGYHAREFLALAKPCLLFKKFGQPFPEQGNWFTRFVLCRLAKRHIWVETENVFYTKYCDRCGAVITKKPSGKTVKFRRYDNFNASPPNSESLNA